MGRHARAAYAVDSGLTGTEDKPMQYLNHFLDAVPLAMLGWVFWRLRADRAETARRELAWKKQTNESLANMRNAMQEAEKQHIRDIADIYNREQINGKFEKLGDRIEKLIGGIRDDIKGGKP